MKCNDLTTLWNILKALRDSTSDPLLAAAIELAMLATIVERDRDLDHHEPLDGK